MTSINIILASSLLFLALNSCQSRQAQGFKQVPSTAVLEQFLNEDTGKPEDTDQVKGNYF